MRIPPNLIDGEWVTGDSVLRNINPSNPADIIGEYAEASAAEVNAAAQAARPGAERIGRAIVGQADAVTFTGSVPTGRAVAAQAAARMSRLIVDRQIVARFTDALLERMQRLVIDAGTSADTDIGPVADERQLAKDLEFIRIGEGEGAHRLTGGELLERRHAGLTCRRRCSRSQPTRCASIAKRSSAPEMGHHAMSFYTKVRTCYTLSA
jgi:acyl-CoA reductase-like NAD-dependent aldehyde dehydrogenase